MGLSISDLNLVERCDQPAILELINVDGKPHDITVQVLGGHSQVVKSFITTNINTRRKQAAMDAKYNSRKKVEYTPIEEDEQFGIESTAIRVVGWEGINDECTLENVIALFKINPHIRNQVAEFSEDLANFTKG